MANSKVFESNLDLLKNLVPGDMVQFPRLCYSHWGIYVGDGNVIHLTTEKTTKIVCSKMLASSSSPTTTKEFAESTVIEQNFFDVANKVKAKKNNYLDGEHRPLSPKKIVKAARSMANKQSGYHPWLKNCKHFATWCRYKIGYSKQTKEFCLDSFSPSIQEAKADTSDPM